MRQLTQDEKLNDLQMHLDYWRNKYNTSHKFFVSEYYNKYQKARAEYSKYFQGKYPNKIVMKPSKDYTMIADLTERFEEFGD